MSLCSKLARAHLPERKSHFLVHMAGEMVVLFGSYGWGDGEWMRSWQEDLESGSATLLAEPVIVNGFPDEEGGQACRQLGEKLAQS